jgi:hypothetical protein
MPRARRPLRAYLALRLVFLLATLARLLGALFFRPRLFAEVRRLTARRAALPAARCAAGVDRRIFERPASSAFAVESSTTPVAAVAAAPNAFPATDFTVLALRRAAFEIARRAFVGMILTIGRPP